MTLDSNTLFQDDPVAIFLLLVVVGLCLGALWAVNERRDR